METKEFLTKMQELKEKQRDLKKQHISTLNLMAFNVEKSVKEIQKIRDTEISRVREKHLEDLRSENNVYTTMQQAVERQMLDVKIAFFAEHPEINIHIGDIRS